MATQTTVGVRELRERATAIVRQVRLKGTRVQITYRGKVIARLIPVRDAPAARPAVSAQWTDLDQLSAEIGAHWSGETDAVAVVRAGRRDL